MLGVRIDPKKMISRIFRKQYLNLDLCENKNEFSQKRNSSLGEDVLAWLAIKRARINSS